jgi:predicted alpha/beta superfamily hydrolase
MSAASGEYLVLVVYPLQPTDRLALRCDLDWDADLMPVTVNAERTITTFRFFASGPFHYFKPVLFHGEEMHWSQGNNYLALGCEGGPGRSEREIYPYFHGDNTCSARELVSLGEGDGRHEVRVFDPPGYEENYLKRYPVLYMQDGQNLFFPDEAFAGSSWRIGETLALLDQMNAVDKMIVVGVYPRDRNREYTRPGYRAYGRFLVEELKPWVDRNFRTLEGPDNTAVMGSSLGGVVSFYLAWQYPEIFGMAACMSSTFGWNDDLRERVATEAKRPVRFYLDSGWPHDNYEVTRDLRTRLAQRGYEQGRDLFYLAFPEAMHNERFWALRAHIPIQLFFGRLRQAPFP